jgi:hypothetical protein
VVNKGLLRIDVRLDLTDSGLEAGDTLSDLFTNDDQYVIQAEFADSVDTANNNVTWGGDTVDFSKKP